MRHTPWIKLLLIPLACAALLVVEQGKSADFSAEMDAGRQAAEHQDYEDAATHFTKANELQQGKCSECYVWLARLDMAGGKLPEALTKTDKALVAACNDAEKARAQLYRGIVFSRQGDLGKSEAALRAATEANPGCVECQFNLGFVLLKESKDAEGAAVLKAIAPQFAGTARGREIQRLIENPGRIRKSYAPEFSAKLRNGEEINLEKLKGKVVLLDFWGTWCAPCRMSLPKLKDLAAKVDPEKVEIISIDEGDPRETWDHFVQDHGMTWPQVYDSDLALHNAFNVDGFPRYYVLGKDGTIQVTFKGWSQMGEATISNAINEALKQ